MHQRAGICFVHIRVPERALAGHCALAAALRFLAAILVHRLVVLGGLLEAERAILVFTSAGDVCLHCLLKEQWRCYVGLSSALARIKRFLFTLARSLARSRVTPAEVRDGAACHLI